jgi:hypothetical protein
MDVLLFHGTLLREHVYRAVAKQRVQMSQYVVDELLLRSKLQFERMYKAHTDATPAHVVLWTDLPGVREIKQAMVQWPEEMLTWR